MLPERVVRPVPGAPLAAVTDAAARVVPQAASGERPVASDVPLAVSDVRLAASGGRPAGSRDARSAELPAALWAV
ncbi:MAG: hypothetical protein PSV22_09650 [Pseudolabrys sp.]|nr:hypothetical protein [Pseudolabrys sp.]